MCVLLFHLFSEVFGSIFPATRHGIGYVLLDGHLAVFVFFVLSGDALSIGYLKRGDASVLDSLLIRRYFRLAVPVVLSSAVVLVLMRFGLTFNKEAGSIVHSEGWLGGVLDFKPAVVDFLRYVLIDVYSPLKQYGAPATEFNPMLWTMSIELPGSYLVFLFWYMFPVLKQGRGILLAALLVLFGFGSYFALFFFGMYLAMLRVDGVIERFRQNHAWQFVAPLVVILSGVVIGLSHEAGERRHINLLCSAALVFSFYTSRPMLGFFRSRLSLFLGEISFPLYLLQFAVIVSLTSYLIVEFAPLSGFAAAAIASVSAIVCLVAAAAFRPIEAGLLRVIDRRLKNLLIKRKATASA